MLEIIDTLIQFRKFKLYPVDLDSILAKVLAPMVAMGSVTTSQAEHSSPRHVNTSSESHERSSGLRRVSRDQPQKYTMISLNGRQVQTSCFERFSQNLAIRDISTYRMSNKEKAERFGMSVTQRQNVNLEPDQVDVV